MEMDQLDQSLRWTNSVYYFPVQITKYQLKGHNRFELLACWKHWFLASWDVGFLPHRGSPSPNICMLEWPAMNVCRQRKGGKMHSWKRINVGQLQECQSGGVVQKPPHLSAKWRQGALAVDTNISIPSGVQSSEEPALETLRLHSEDPPERGVQFRNLTKSVGESRDQASKKSSKESPRIPPSSNHTEAPMRMQSFRWCFGPCANFGIFVQPFSAPQVMPGAPPAHHTRYVADICSQWNTSNKGDLNWVRTLI